MMNNLKIPKSLAIIMDGNGRWGKLHKGNRTQGHIQGIVALENIIKACIKYGIKTLSVYAFSTENWKRPSLEVNTLMFLFKKYLINKRESLLKEGIRLVISGSKTNISKDLQITIDETCDFLKSNDKLILNICFNYGGQQEIIDAVNSLIQKGKKTIDLADLEANLYNNIDFPDLVIRTGGELRISNFLIWQLAYSELYFTDCLWPDFNEDELLKALKDFSNRDRRYGGLTNEKK